MKSQEGRRFRIAKCGWRWTHFSECGTHSTQQSFSSQNSYHREINRKWRRAQVWRQNSASQVQYSNLQQIFNNCSTCILKADVFSIGRSSSTQRIFWVFDDEPEPRLCFKNGAAAWLTTAEARHSLATEIRAAARNRVKLSPFSSRAVNLAR